MEINMEYTHKTIVSKLELKEITVNNSNNVIDLGNKKLQKHGKNIIPRNYKRQYHYKRVRKSCGKLGPGVIIISYNPEQEKYILYILTGLETKRGGSVSFYDITNIYPNKPIEHEYTTYTPNEVRTICLTNNFYTQLIKAKKFIRHYNHIIP